MCFSRYFKGLFKMDQQLVNWCLCGFGVLIGFTLKNLWEALDDLQKADKELVEKVTSLEILVASACVKKDEFTNFLSTLFMKLDKIEDKIDKKVDKR
jgi:hypothetical protein